MLKRVADIDITALQRQIPDSDMTKHTWTLNYKYVLGMIGESHINNHNKCDKIKHNKCCEHRTAGKKRPLLCTVTQ
jgi:hypothetical protein